MKEFLIFMGVVFLVVIIEDVTRNTVYVCSDKELNPPDVQEQCKRFTRGQWWAT
jgi:hypothetical protein